jgi:hypothetical protein
MRGKAANLASDVRNLMQIHQGEDQRVEDREHVGHGRKANAAAIFPPSGHRASNADDFQWYNHKRQVRLLTVEHVAFKALFEQ